MLSPSLSPQQDHPQEEKQRRWEDHKQEKGKKEAEFHVIKFNLLFFLQLSLM